MKVSYFTKIVGVTFEGRQDIIKNMSGAEKLGVQREPNNEYDKNAVAVIALTASGWAPIGYISKESNVKLAEHMDGGGKVEIALSEITGGGEQLFGVNVSIDYETEGSTMVKLIPVIGDGYVMFDPESHTYFDEDGKRMLSGSVFEKEQSKEPNFGYIAKAVSKTTGVPSEDILEIWNSNRDMAAEYGTLMHKGLETYIKNFDKMRQIDSARERAHTAMNFMPESIGLVVDSFIGRFSEDFPKKCIPEAFVRYKDRCGFIDILKEEGNNSYSIYDYKFTKNIDEIKYQDYGKKTKYTLQQNFYREIIEANGHKVNTMSVEWYKDGWSSVKIEKVPLELE